MSPCGDHIAATDAKQSQRFGLACLVVSCSSILVLYSDTLSTMVSLWTVERYRHAFAVPFLSGFLLWRNRHCLEQPWQFSWIGLCVLVAAVWMWTVSRMTLLQVGEHVALVLMLNGAVWTIVGNRVFRAILFPMAFLAFALPVGRSLVPLLMEITADLASLGLRSVGIPVFREGMVFTLAGGVFEVADVCSGIRYLNVGLTLGTFLAALSFRSAWTRVVYVAAIAVVFVLANGIRAFITMAVASATDMKYLGGVDHIYFGWVMFLIVMMFMFWLASRYADS